MPYYAVLPYCFYCATFIFQTRPRPHNIFSQICDVANVDKTAVQIVDHGHEAGKGMPIFRNPNMNIRKYIVNISVQ